MSALSEWLSDAETVKDIEKRPSVAGPAIYVVTSEHADSNKRLKDGDFWEMLKWEGRTGKKGRPRKASRFWRFVRYHNQDRLSNVPSVAVDGYFKMLPTNIRNYADTHSNELEKHFAGWCREMAEAMEAGDAARTADCGFRAIQELQSLYDAYVMPYAHIQRKTLRGARKGGRAPKEKS
jgi:hypothetical protein